MKDTNIYAKCKDAIVRHPKRTNRVTQNIPTKRIAWNEQEPGHFEVDTVHHCGYEAKGEFVHTLQLIDVATGWSERVATLGRSYTVISNAFQRILVRVPFPVRELHPDNGSEFMNNHLVNFWGEEIASVEFSRSRPYEKNDNRFVEQKNGSLVRAYLGLDRFDTAEQTNLINVIYDKMWLYYNFFQPVMRLAEKTVIPSPDKRRRVKRRYDQAKTPFERLCETGTLSSEKENELKELRLKTNPRQLRDEIYLLLNKLFSLPNSTPGQTEDVFLTLFSE